MKIQLMSDLHLEVEDFHPEPALGADVLVLAGDIDSRWIGLEYFKHWPVPVIFVAGNHEFDRRDQDSAWPQLRELCQRFGIHLLEKQSLVLQGFPEVQFLACTRWCDFDLLGVELRDKAMRAAKHYLLAARMSRGGKAIDAAGVRMMALEAQHWLHHELQRARLWRQQEPPKGGTSAPSGVRKLVVITHFAPSSKSADPRYGLQPGTAGFCNNDDALMEGVDLWLHGHLHCPSFYQVGSCQVRANPRGYTKKGEVLGFDPQVLIEL
jgi:predicted phosphodiesterase